MKKIYFIFLIIYPIYAFGQLNIQAQLTFKCLTTDDGLSHNKVNCICQDYQGFIWFGTNEGLNKYDGYNITIYRNDPNDSTTIKQNYVSALLKDSYGNLWIGHPNKGLDLYDQDKNSFIEYKYNNGKKHFTRVYSIHEDQKGYLWICSFDTVFYLNTKTHQVVNWCKYPVTPYGNTIIYKYEDSRNNLWFGTSEDGLYLFNRKSLRFKRFINRQNDKKSISDIRIESVFEDHLGNLWIGTADNGINLYNYNDSTFTRVIIDNKNKLTNKVRAIAEDKKGNLWFGTNNGLYLKDSSSNTFYQYAHTDHDFSKLSNNSINNIFIDNNEVIWIGTYSGGVNYADLNKKKFVHYSKKNNNRLFLNDNIIQAFAEDKNHNLWIGTDDGGINILHRKAGSFSYITHNPVNNNSLSINNVKVLVNDNAGNFWIGTYQGGLDYFDIKSNSFTHYKHDPKNPNSLDDDRVYALLLSSDNHLWIGTGIGVDVFNIKNKRFERHYKYSGKHSGTIGILRVNVIYEDSKNNIWIGAFFNGLHKLNKKTGLIDGFRRDVFNKSIITIYEDTRKNLWLGGENGLYYIETKSNQIIHHTRDKNGLSLFTVYGILEDKHGNIWLSTSASGLIKFINAVNNPGEPNFKNFDIDNGIQSKQFNPNACYKSKTGEMFFGGINGLNAFYPDEIKENPYKPKVAIINLKIFNETVPVGKKFNDKIILNKSISQLNELILSYKYNVFTLEFAGLHNANPLKNEYAYMMEGFENKWNYVDNKREATYTNLEPGEYTFRVKASNNDGIWNERGTSIKIIILPPWWKTWWFKLILGLCILVCIVYVVLKVINKIKRLANQTILDERNQLKTLINNIPDRVFIKDTKSRFLVINKATIQILNCKNEKEIINKTDYDFYPKEIADIFFKQELEILSTGVPVINEEGKRFKNDQVLFVSTTKCPIINSKGETIGLVGIVKDITSQKMAELEIIKQSEELKNYNTSLNESNVLLEERQQQIEQQAEELHVHAENLKEANEFLIEKQKLIQLQSDKLQESNKQLSVLNSTKDRFFSIIAHDLRNPFHVVSGFAEILLNDYKKLPFEKIEKFLNLILTSSTSGNALLENLLQWSRSQTGRMAYDPTNLNLLTIAEETIHFLESHANQKNISIQSQIDPNITVFADENMLKTIFRNLISNAIKFTPEHGSITIKSTITNSQVEVVVADTGVGIPGENLVLLFRVDATVTTKGTSNEPGTGLGLILCKEFVEKHKGKIWVESEVGQGSEFKFTLPCI